MKKLFLHNSLFTLILFFCILNSNSANAQYNLTVAQDGSGNYTTVQAAVDAAPTGGTAPFVIYIKNGKYKEKINVPSTKPFITFVGQSVGGVILTYNDYSGKAMPGGGTYGTGNSASVTIAASDFTAINITFENTTGESPQALAINVTGDRCAFKNCRFLGGQDTIYAGNSGMRQYFRNCYVDGDVDFIFGDARAVFDSTYIYPKTRSSAGASYITAANTKQAEPYGYVFRNCKILMNRGSSVYYLGRPWQNDANTPDASKSWNKTIYLNTAMSSDVQPAGWSTWDAGTDVSKITYAEYKSHYFNNTLVDTTQRVSWSKQLTDAQAANYYNNSNLFGSWDPCSTYANFCTNNAPDLVVSNFQGVKGASASSFTWNISWPVQGATFELLRSSDKVNFSPVNTQTAASDTAVNFSYTDALPAPGGTYYYIVRTSNAGYTTSVTTDTVSISSIPTITVAGTLGNFLQGIGTPSAAQSYVVSAASLTNNLMITAPAPYELSTNGSTWSPSTSPVVLAQDANGNIANTTIYVRLNATTAGTYTGTLFQASQGADTIRLSVNGTVQNEPLSVSDILQWYPMTVNAMDSAALRAVGVGSSAPTLSNFSESNGIQYDTAPLPAYSSTQGQALSGSPGGTGDWRTSSGGPGGNLSRVHYEQFTISSTSGYTLRVDSLLLNNSFYSSSSNTKIAVQYSLSNFASDSAEITGGKSGVSQVTFLTNNGFTKAVAVPQENTATTNNFRFALNGTAGVAVGAGQTITVRIYFSCGSSSRNRYAKIKDLYFKGVSNKIPVAGDFRSYQTGIWTDLNTWERFDGTNWVHPAPEFPHYSNTSGTMILNGHIVTLSTNFTEGFGYIPKRTIIKKGGQLVVNSGIKLNLANDGTPAAATTDLQVDGNLNLNGALYTNGNVSMVVTGSFINSGTAMNLSNTGDTVSITGSGIWQQNTNSSNTPTRFYFDPTASFLITGLTSAQTGLFKNNVKYGNIVWNNTGETAYYAIRTTLDTSNVKGSFTVQNTGSTYLSLSNSSARITVPGGYYQTGGTVNYRESGTIADTLDIGGDFNVTGGSFISNMGTGSSLLVRLTGINKSINYNQTTATNTNWNVNGSYVLNSNFSLPSAGFGLNVAGSLNLGSFIVSGAGDFSTTAGSVISSAVATGLDGNLTNTGSKAFDPATSFVYNGTLAQVTGSLLPPTIGGLTINNLAGVSLTAATAINGALTLTNGELVLGANSISANSISGSTSAKYVVTNGTGTLEINNVGNSDKIFPVGPTATQYNPATLNNTGALDNFSVSVKNTIDYATPTPYVVNKQWNISEETAGGSNVTLKLGWTTADQSSGFDPTAPLYILHYNGSLWDATRAAVSGTGTAADPYIATASGFTNFSPFIISNKYGVLPITFLSANAYSKTAGVQVEWTTASEQNVTSYLVERSVDGINFSVIATIAPKNNSGNSNYSWFDATPNAGNNFYRIEGIDYSGSKFSNILKVTIGTSEAQLVINSNPVKGGALAITMKGLQAGVYSLSLFNNAGQQVFKKNVEVRASSFTEVEQLPALARGVYTLQLSNGSTALTSKIVID